MQMETDAMSFRREIVTVQMGGTIVGSHEDVEVAVAVEIAVSEATADLWRSEASSRFVCSIAKFSTTLIQEKLRRLSVAGVASYIANGFVNVTVGDGEVESAIKINIEEHAAEAESIFGGCTHTGRNGNVVENSRRCCAIEADHFVVEVGDGYSRVAGTCEISRIHSHAGASFSFGAEGQAGCH